MPPKRDEMISSQVVTSWAPEFDPLGESITEDSMALDAAGNGVSGDFVDLVSFFLGKKSDLCIVSVV
jgi:hypothetical protein